LNNSELNNLNSKLTGHDFKNIMGNILVGLDALKSKLSFKQDIFILIENIEKSVLRALEILKSSDSKDQTKKKILTEPGSLLDELINFISVSLSNDIVFTKEIHENLKYIFCEPTEIFRALLNILTNAVEAMSNTGELYFSAKIIDASETDVIMQTNNIEYLEIIIKDTGKGIPENLIDKIFDLEFSTKSKNKNSGLGLFITKKIIQEHNGFIKVESTSEVGTRFKVYLPAFEKITTPEKKINRKNIVIIDDEAILLELLAELLEGHNFIVYKFTKGKEGFDFILKNHLTLNLLLIDKKLPDSDGLEIIKTLRSKGIKVPVILATGSTSDNLEQIMIENKLEKILLKPYRFEHVLELISELIKIS